MPAPTAAPTVTFTSAGQPPDDPGVLAIGIRADRLADDLAALPAGHDTNEVVLDAAGFEGKPGQRRFVAGPAGEVLLLVGLGPAAAVDTAALRKAAAGIGRACRRQATVTVDLLRLAGDGAEGADGPAGAQAIAEGVLAGSYRFDVHRSDVAQPIALAAVHVVGKGGKRLQAGLDKGATVGRAVSFARNLVNEPGGTLTPPVFAERAVVAAKAAGLKLTVLDAKAIEKERMGGLLGVNRGSHQPPRFLEVAWEPEKPRGFVALVGKGITFDAGGLSIKTAEGMSTMKDDMGGAAAIFAALTAVPEVAPRLRVAAYLPLTDNMLGPDAMRVGDVLTMRNGTTVEVLNTDAEGRLVLADALVKASDDGPDAIIDLATLTGAAEVALGMRIAALMGNHDDLVQMIRDASDATGEEVWPLPLPGHMRRYLDSDIADLRNISSGRGGGALIAGLFLSRFVGDGIPWAHLDIAGPAWSREDDVETGKGGTGFGVRLLLHLLGAWHKPRA